MPEFPYLRWTDHQRSWSLPCSWLAWLPGSPPRLVGLGLMDTLKTLQAVPGVWPARIAQGKPVTLWTPPPLTGAVPPSLLPDGRWPWFARTQRITTDTDHPTAWAHQLWLPRTSLTPAIGAPLPDALVLVHWGEPSTVTATLWAWLQDQPIPLDPSWRDSFFAHAPQLGLRWTVASQWTAPSVPAPTLVAVEGLQTLDTMISEGLRQHWWTIPEGTGPNPAATVPAPTTADEYLVAWAPALHHQLDHVVRPRVQAQTPVDPAWATLLRTPWPAQQLVIQGSSATLDALGVDVILGEPGCGKTLMMALVPWDQVMVRQHRPGVRVLVIAPDHLLAKWSREIQQTIPGAQVHALESWRDVLTHREAWQQPPTGPEYWILGRDRAKLGPRWQFSGHWSQLHAAWTCPDCGQILRHPHSGIPWPRRVLPTLATRHCPACQAVVWSVDRSLRRIAPMDLLRRYARQRFDCVIFDEVDELTGETAQGQVFRWGRQVGRTLLAGTGTLTNGYAESLHYLQFALNPAALLAEGIPHDGTALTQKRYGRIRTTERFTTQGTSRSIQKRLPGISPLWFATKMVEHTAVIRLDDLGTTALPPYDERVQWVTMTPDQAARYTAVQADLRTLATTSLRTQAHRFLGHLVQTSLTLADEPWRTLDLSDDQQTYHWDPPSTLTEAQHYPKEVQILQDIQDELTRGRRVWVFTMFTKAHPQADRLLQLLQAAGIRATILRPTTVPRQQREAWIAHQVAQGIEVVISHPKLVSVGLDLLAFPSLFWYSTGNILTLVRQASRRAWRIGQTAPCITRLYAYRETLEEAALYLLAEKLEAARVVEGDLSLEGLQRIADQSAQDNGLARALVQGWAPLRQAATSSLVLPAPLVVPTPPLPVSSVSRSEQLTWQFA